jgi:hypothetical protein
MSSRIKVMLMSLFLTKSARWIVVVALCALVFVFSEAFSMADDYRCVRPAEPEGDQRDQPIIRFDPKICKVYEENLRYFAKRNRPMSCNRPIAPHLEDRIKEVKWEDLDPDQYPELFRAIVTCNRYLTGTGEDVIQRDLKYVRADIANKVKVFRRAKLSLVGRIQVQAYSAPPEPYWIVQYGANDMSPNNPNSFYKCTPTRGGGKQSNLHLYIVSEEKHELTTELFVSIGRPSTEGQHLRIIDNRLFVENIHPGAWIELDEVDTAIPAGVTACMFQFQKSK